MRHVLVMGVCGCGKSSIGQAVAEALQARFVEGDEFHSAENRARMAGGQPLSDAMREGWLDDIGAHVAQGDARCVIACSALKRSYRDRLAARIGQPVIVHLTGSRDLLTQRMAGRTDHFMPVSLLDSQFADLEPPQGEDAAHIDVALTREDVVAAALAHIAERGRAPSADRNHHHDTI